MRSTNNDRGWDKVADWYDKLTGTEGHYYQRAIIFPKTLELIKGLRAKSVLDLGCGQGVLERSLPPQTEYWGIDISPSLITQAIERNACDRHVFTVGDAADPKLSLKKINFDVVTVILAIQDIKEAGAVFQNASNHLREGGHLIIVMNHPYFRIPRQSQWYVDEGSKVQSRLIKSYLSELDIPITVNPGKARDSHTVRYYHRPLSTYFQLLSDAGFSVTKMEEWVSDKLSTGAKAKMENRARKEFPLFLCLVSKKN